MILPLAFKLLSTALLVAAASPSTNDVTFGTVKTSSSITTIITNSNLGSDFSVNTKSESSSTTDSSSSHVLTTSTLPKSLTTENSDDMSLFKFMFTLNSYYYDIPVLMNDQGMNLRLDIIQNDVWVINGNEVMNCLHINTWWSSETSVHGTEISELPASVTTASEYLATFCADAGAFTTDDDFIESLPDSQAENMENLDHYRIPYLNSINSSGVVLTGNLTLFNSNLQSVKLTDLSFVDVNDSDVFVGAFGLAGNHISHGGILNFLTDQEVIQHNGYSLHFGTFADTGVEYAQVIPGMVNNKYYNGDFYSFDLLENVGDRFQASEGEGFALANELVKNMLIPSAELTDIILKNEYDGQTISLKSDFKQLPVIFDTRTVFNLMPLDVIVNIAMQTNAFYSDQVNRWLVECDTIINTHATINFKFGELSIDVPIEDCLMNATSYGSQLTFSNGKDACYLAFLPTSEAFSTLGLSFLKSMYLAIDNEGGKIGMARANKQLQVKQSDYFSLNFSYDDTSPYKTKDALNATGIKSIAVISSDNIPFATALNVSQSLTLTYSPSGDYQDTLTVPARFSGAFITSGEVFLTHSLGEAASSPVTGFATAASEDDGNDDDSFAVSNQVLGVPLKAGSYGVTLILLAISFVVILL